MNHHSTCAGYEHLFLDLLKWIYVDLYMFLEGLDNRLRILIVYLIRKVNLQSLRTFTIICAKKKKCTLVGCKHVVLGPAQMAPHKLKHVS